MKSLPGVSSIFHLQRETYINSNQLIPSYLFFLINKPTFELVLHNSHDIIFLHRVVWAVRKSQLVEFYEFSAPTRLSSDQFSKNVKKLVDY